MVRFWITLFLVLTTAPLWAQQLSLSVGAFTGATTTFTLDNGINRDPRYTGSYGIKFAPIGLNFGMDYEYVGIVATPGIINLGQTFYVVNTSGGQDGKRNIDLQYLHIPIAFKVHIINLSFFKLGGLVAFGAAYLLDGNETVTHTETKLKFPEEVYPILPPDYVVQYDGVASPEVNDYSIGAKKDFRSLQFFVGAGFRSDWDITNHWRICFDFRLNYGLYDPRTDEYLAKLNSNQTLYDLPGKRNELFAQLSVGISRYIEFDRSDLERKRKLKGNSKKFTPMIYEKRGKKPKN